MRIPIIADYHMHTPRCKHAAGPMEAYVERAIAIGLKEVGFSDHNPLPNGWGANVRMGEAELDDYAADVLRLRARYRSDIAVRLGIEMDYVAGAEAYLKAQAARHPWDYIIGSVHYLDPECRQFSWPSDFRDGTHALFAQYYARMEQLARSGIYDIVAHFDVPKRAGVPAAEAELAPMRAALRAIAEAGMCMEINTSGYRHPEPAFPDAYPTPAICAEALALGIPLCVNSDAHRPQDVGSDFDRATQTLRAIGCNQLARFADRQRTLYAIA